MKTIVKLHHIDPNKGLFHIHPSHMPTRVKMPSITKISLKICFLKFHLKLLYANELRLLKQAEGVEELPYTYSVKSLQTISQVGKN